jgi:hypothetical protein
MKRAAALVFTCWTALSLSAAETAAARGKRVVEQALDSLGGKAYLQMEDRVETGRAYSFFREELSGLSIATIYPRYLTPGPEKPARVEARERQAFGKDEASSVLFSEIGAWEITFRGARPLDDQRVTNYRESTLRNIFYILRQRLSEPGLTFFSRGSDIVDNVPVEIVDLTDAEDRTVTVYFSQSTRLPVKQTYKRRNEQYKDWDAEVTYFAKYRDVADNIFTLPANLKILPKPRR